MSIPHVWVLNTLTRLFKDYYKIYPLEETTLTKNSETNGLFNMNYRLEERVGDFLELSMAIPAVVILFVTLIDDWFVGVSVQG